MRSGSKRCVTGSSTRRRRRGSSSGGVYRMIRSRVTICECESEEEEEGTSRTSWSDSTAREGSRTRTRYLNWTARRRNAAVPLIARSEGRRNSPESLDVEPPRNCRSASYSRGFAVLPEVPLDPLDPPDDAEPSEDPDRPALFRGPDGELVPRPESPRV